MTTPENEIPQQSEPTTPESKTVTNGEAKPNADMEDEKTPVNKPRDKRGLKHFLVTIAIVSAVLAVVFLIGIVPRLRAKPVLDKKAKQQANAVPKVNVIHPDTAPAVTTLTLPANIEPVQETDISARASGFVNRWLVDIGDHVTKGQTLAVIDTPDVDQQVAQATAQVGQARAQVIQQQAEASRALANLAQARQNAERQRQQLIQGQSDLNLARVTAQRWRYLVKEGAVSQQAADQQIAAEANNQANVAALTAAVAASRSDIQAYEAALRSAQANVDAARSNVRASEANLRRYSTLKAFKVVRAPFSGVVTSRSVDAGALLGGGSGEASGSGSGSAGGGTPANGTSGAEGGNDTSSASAASANSSRNAPYSARASTGTTSAGTATGGQGVSSGTGSNTTTGGNLAAVTTDNSASATGTVPRNSSNNAGGGTTAPATAAFSGNSASGGEGIGGAVVSPGTSLYHIARMDEVRVQINVPQEFVPNVRVGNRTNITVRELPNTTFAGRITRTASTLDPQTRTLLTEVLIPNRGGRLLPGMYAQVVFSVPRSVVPLILASSALIANEKGTQVAVVDAESKTVRLVPVVVGRDYGKQIEIQSGITASDLVVVDPSDQTQDGTKVEPVLPKPKEQQGTGQQQGGGSAKGGPGNKASGTPSDLGANYGGSLSGPRTTEKPNPANQDKKP